MEAQQEARLNMYRTVENISNANITLISTIPAFLTAFNNFKAAIAKIITTATAESLKLSGITIDKQIAKNTLCSTATDMAALIFAYASSISNNTLKQEVKFTYTQLFRLKDDILVPTTKNILHAANANAAALSPFGVTPATIAALQASMDNYSAAVPRPRSAKAIKGTSTKNLKLYIKEADEILKNQLDKIIVNFKTTNPDFVSTYKAARIIIDPTKSVTQIKGTITSQTTQAPIPNATIQITGTNTTSTTTNPTGHYAQKPITPGTSQITITAPGFQPKTITAVFLQLGKTTTLNIQLTPIL